MPEQPSEQSVPDVSADPIMHRFREYVAALISLVVVVGTIVMMITALNYVNSPDLDPSEKFARVKDLLLFINPMLGVVVGYYFNKVTSEARAETAETTAKSAMASAQLAAEARNAAETEAKTAKGEAEEAKSALKEVGEVAEKMMVQAPAATTLGVDESGEPVEDPRMEFKIVWERAKRLIE